MMVLLNLNILLIIILSISTIKCLVHGQTSGVGYSSQPWPGSDELSLREASVLVQYGDGRSGSTFQWYVLCTIMRIINNYSSKAFSCKKNIFKIHYPDRSVRRIMSEFDNMFKDPNMHIYYFLSSRDMKVNATMFGGNHTVVYMQRLTDLVERKLGVLFDYQQLFNLSDMEMRILYQHMRYWDILRQCCGLQQSIYNRMVLHNVSLAPNSYLDLGYPACEVYNITQVESSFLKTTVSVKLPGALWVDYTARLVYPGSCQDMEDLLRNGTDFKLGQKFSPPKDGIYQRSLEPISLPSRYRSDREHWFPLRDAEVIVVYGDDASGSSFQWYSICSIMRIIHYGKQDVNCGSHHHKHAINVVKHHHVDGSMDKVKADLDDQFRDQLKYYFLAPKVMEVESEQFTGSHVLAYTLRREDAEVHSLGPLFDYMQLFSLSDMEMRILYQHIRYWDVLRQCCGSQRPAVYESDLDLGYPACEMYNLTQVETSFLRSNLSLSYGSNMMKYNCLATSRV